MFFHAVFLFWVFFIIEIFPGLIAPLCATVLQDAKISSYKNQLRKQWIKEQHVALFALIEILFLCNLYA